MVFQSYALYPHMSVYKNIAFPLKMAKMPPDAIDKKVQDAARVLNLSNYLDRRPGQLSGGQRQRVAIGRAIVREPTAFLFDEPLSNLDAALRGNMRLEISELHHQLKTTMVYVTHDQVEAMTMADKIVVLRKGKVEQIGSPLALYNAPCNQFVAGFIGSPRMNFIEGHAGATTPSSIEFLATNLPPITLPAGAHSVKLGDALTLGIRAEHLEVGPSEAAWPVDVEVAEHYGASSYLHGRLRDGTALLVHEAGQSHARRGDQLSVGLPAHRCHLFDATHAAVPAGAALNPAP
ncbi:MAG TPA: ATP-binding cassette domain-containing protein, partial [Devosia sp.]|nr:ATP-binding cassette domain-containing protein [Devosia sp.]